MSKGVAAIIASLSRDFIDCNFPQRPRSVEKGGRGPTTKQWQLVIIHNEWMDGGEGRSAMIVDASKGT